MKKTLEDRECALPEVVELVKGERIERKKDKKFLTLFIVLFLSFLVAIAGFALGNTYKIILSVCLIFLQAVILKNILDDYYEHL